MKRPIELIQSKVFGSWLVDKNIDLGIHQDTSSHPYFGVKFVGLVCIVPVVPASLMSKIRFQFVSYGTSLYTVLKSKTSLLLLKSDLTLCWNRFWCGYPYFLVNMIFRDFFWTNSRIGDCLVVYIDPVHCKHCKNGNQVRTFNWIGEEEFTMRNQDTIGNAPCLEVVMRNWLSRGNSRQQLRTQKHNWNLQCSEWIRIDSESYGFLIIGEWIMKAEMPAAQSL